MLLIRNAQVLDPQPRGTLDVLVGAGHILAMDRDLAPGLPAEVIDAQGALLCPGFVDSLVHLSGGGGEGGFATRTPALRPEQALRAGVTTLIGALGTDDVTRSHADLLASARALSASGLTACILTGSYQVPAPTLTGDIRRDLVLIPEIIGVGEIAIADHRGSHPSVVELARIGADARVGGMLAGKRGTVLVHVGDHDDGISRLHEVCEASPIPVAQWHPTHMNRHAALLRQAAPWAARGGTVDLTASTTPTLIAAGDVPAALALRQLLHQGVSSERITLSSDAQASLPHFADDGTLLAIDTASMDSLLQVVREAIEEHGLPLSQVLQTVTSTPADVWGLRKGRIAVGMDADLVLLDPRTLHVQATVARGQVHRFDR